MLEPGLPRRCHQLRQECTPDSAAARLRADIDVRHVRGLATAVAEHAEHERHGVAVVLSEQRHAVLDRDGDVLPGLVPGLAEVRLLLELGLELLPQLTQQIVVGFGGGSDRHR